MPLHGETIVHKGTGITYTVGTFSPELAAALPRYPKTPESYERMRATRAANSAKARAAGILVNRSTPHGWGTTVAKKKRLVEARAEANKKAVALVDKVALTGAFESDAELAEWRARLAFGALAALAFCEAETATTRMAAVRAILDFTMTRPSKAKDARNVGLGASMAENILATILPK